MSHRDKPNKKNKKTSSTQHYQQYDPTYQQIIPANGKHQRYGGVYMKPNNELPPFTINIKELNLNIINPNAHTLKRHDKGSKIVVIGKPGCFAKGTRVLMHDGKARNIEDIQIGDYLLGDDGTTIRTVLELCSHRENMWRVIPKNKTPSYIVNESHLLVLAKSLEDVYNNNVLEISVGEYIKGNQNRKGYRIFRRPIPFFHGNDHDTFPITLDVITSKRIYRQGPVPSEYLYNHYGVRRAYFKHFLNEYHECFWWNLNAHLCLSQKAISTYCSQEYIQSFIFMSRSMGICVTEEKTPNNNPNDPNDPNDLNDLNDIIIIFHSPLVRMCTSPQKSGLANAKKSYATWEDLSSEFTLESIGPDRYYGFTLDGNHRFLLESCDVVRNTGKSTCVSSILYAKRKFLPAGMVLSGTEDTDPFYSKFLPHTFIFNEYEESRIEAFVRRQKLAINHLPNPWAFLLLDDCTDSPGIFKRPIQQGMYKRGRHFACLYITCFQYSMDMPATIRNSIDGTFILREPLLRNRKSLWENFASIVPTFRLFCDLLDQVTGDHTALYIHNTSTTNDWQDCVFWYKGTPPPPGFRLGAPEYWHFHKQRYDPLYVNPM